MMTKKDYVKFADMLVNRHVTSDCIVPKMFRAGYIACIEHIILDLTELFESDNPNFDASRFNDYIENKVKQILDSVQ